MRFNPVGTRQARALVSPQTVTDPSGVTAAPMEAVVAMFSAGVASREGFPAEPGVAVTAPLRWSRRPWFSRAANPTMPVRLVSPGRPTVRNWPEVLVQPEAVAPARMRVPVRPFRLV